MNLFKPFHFVLLFLAALTMISAYPSGIPLVSAETQGNQQVATPAPSSPVLNEYGYVLFEDDFSSSKHWVESAYWSRTQGEYQILVSVFNNTYYIKAPINLPSNQYSVEADCRFIQGNEGGYGLMINVNNNDTGSIGSYFFVVLPFVQKYYLTKLTYTGLQAEIPSTTSSYIKPGAVVNHLKVFCNGDLIKLYVNGQLLTEKTINAFNADKIKLRTGLAGRSLNSAPVTVRFDNFKITVPKEAIK